MIFINTKTLNAPLTGVQRYVQEILNHSPAHILQQVQPPSWVKGPLGHLWEQTVLPIQVKNNLLFSPANSGPILTSKQVLTLHDLAILETPEDFAPAYRQYYEWLWPRLLPKVAHIITVSEFTRQRVMANYKIKPNKITAIPLGVNHKHFYPRTPNQIQQAHQTYNINTPYILALSSLSPRKNLPALLQAWQQALPKLPNNTQLLLAGGAGASNVLKSANLTQLPPRTRLLGRIDDTHLPALLTGAEAFVFPSLYEGFGLPPLEAMACGTPCLVTNTTSVPEVTGTAALTFNPQKPEEIANSLIQILTQPKLAAKLKSQSITQAQKFHWTTTTQKTFEIINNL